MRDHLYGLDIIGGDETTDKAVALAKAPRPTVNVSDGGGTSLAMVAGIGLTIIVGAIALPKIIKYVG